MKQELIHISNVKVARLEEMEDNLGALFPDNRIIEVKKIEKIGKPFSVITKECFENKLSIDYQPDRIFKKMNSSVTLEKYLNLAEIKFNWSKSEKKQYLGFIHGSPTDISSTTNLGDENIGIKRCIIPCQFYLIKDDIKPLP